MLAPYLPLSDACIPSAVVAVVGGASVVGGATVMGGVAVVGGAAVVGGTAVVGGVAIGDVGGRALVMGGVGGVVGDSVSVAGVLQSGPMNPGTQFTTNLTENANPAIAAGGVTITVPGAPLIALDPT